MKANITLKLDATLIPEIQELAAAENTSVSALLTTRLEQIVGGRKTYERAQKRALAQLREGLDLQWAPPRFTGSTSRVMTAPKLKARNFPDL